jgi:hypothetical protein
MKTKLCLLTGVLLRASLPAAAVEEAVPVPFDTGREAMVFERTGTINLGSS